MHGRKNIEKEQPVGLIYIGDTGNISIRIKSIHTLSRFGGYGLDGLQCLFCNSKNVYTHIMSDTILCQKCGKLLSSTEFVEDCDFAIKMEQDR